MFLLLTRQAKLRQGQIMSLVPGMTDAHILDDILLLSWGQNWNLFSFADNCINNAFFFFQRRNETKIHFYFFLIWKQGMTTWIKKSKASSQFPENILQASLRSGQLNCYSRNWNLKSKQRFPHCNFQTEYHLAHSHVGRLHCLVCDRPRYENRANSWL